MLPRLNLLLLFVFGAVSAQQLPVDVRGNFGYAGFAEGTFRNHFAAGVSSRFYLSPRVGLEPEFTYTRRDQRDRNYVFIPAVTYDFAGTRQVQPYVIGGIGVAHNRGRIGRVTVTDNRLSLGIGMGLKAYLTRNVFIAPEARLGWEPVVRITTSIGYSFGRR